MIGHSIGQYRILDKLGQGGMGIVYLAEDTRLNRRVAVKVLPPELSRDQERRERLRQEARAAASLLHPGIATVFALEEVDETLLLVSEYVPGKTLAADRQRAPLPFPLLLDTTLAIAEALAVAHERGVVHRDLKPENIIRGDDGRIRILDFGLARVQPGRTGVTSVTRTEPGILLGTLSYMSPEQLRGEPIDFRSDLFSLGVIVHELSAGVHPFEGPTPESTIARIQSAEPGALSRLDQTTPAEFSRIVRKCLQNDKTLRYQSTRDLVVDLDQLRRDLNRAPAAGADEDRGRVPSPGPSVRRWWDLHHLTLMVLTAGMLYPMWTVHRWIPGRPGVALFFGYLTACAVVASLRGHLLFTARVNPRSLGAELRQASPWIQWLDHGGAGSLLVAAAIIAPAHNWWAALLVTVAVGMIVASWFIEPATTRAAFGRPAATRRPTRRKAASRTARRPPQ